MKDTIVPLTSLRNIGKTIAEKLQDIGVHSKEDLEKMGVVEAYKRIKENNPDETVPLCYNLYSLQGALLDVHWNELPQGMKETLKDEAESYV